MELYEILLLLFLGMLLFVPVAVICFLPRFKKNNDDKNDNDNTSQN